MLYRDSNMKTTQLPLNVQPLLIFVLPSDRLETSDWTWELRETLWLTGRMVGACDFIS